MDAEAFYRKRLVTDRGANAADYESLDQGPIGTRNRQSEAIKAMKSFKKFPKTILDLGCGTGLLIDRLAEEGLLPDKYVGVDFLAERQAYVLQRADRHKLSAQFVAADVREYLQNCPAFDAVLAVGLVGHDPFHSLTRVATLLTQMQRKGDMVFMSLPRPYTDCLGHAHQMHFDPDDAAVIFNDVHKLRLNIRVNAEREFYVWA